ncbi:MAG: TonB-dependent receptor, partial [Gammaproteobacteria bacterium]
MTNRHLMLLSALAIAQAANAAPIEVMTVTAQKREAAMTDVAVTMEAIGNDELRSNNIYTPQDVAFLVPNVDIKGTSQGQVNPAITIRGVGMNNFNSNNNGSAGVYLNEVFLTSPGLMSLAMMDVERVEVLKGPQGTLYGRNSSAGAMNLVSVKPTEELDGFATFTGGNYETIRAEGAISNGIADNWAFRVSGLYDEQGESFHDNNLTGSDFGESKNYAARGQLAYLGDKLDANLTLGYQKQDVVNNPLTNFGLFDAPTSFTPCAAAANGSLDNSQCFDVLGYQNGNSDPFKHDFNTTRAPELRSDSDVYNLSLFIDYAISDTLTFTSVTGYVEQDRIYGENTWSTPNEMIAAVHDEKLDQFSQEFRLGGETGIATWIAGIYYGTDNIKADNIFNSTDLLGPFFGVNPLLWGFEQDTEAAAVFGSIDWQLSDTLTLVTGLRYTDEQVDFTGATIGVDAADPAVSFELDSTNVTCPDTAPKCVFEDDNTDYRVALEWRPTDELLAYGTVSTGFKSGGFNGDFVLDPGTGGYLPFDSETLTAYEVGAKSTLADGSIQLNGAVFYYDYKDFQTLAPTTIGFTLTNLEKAKLIGFDLDLVARPTDQLDLRFGLGYVDTEITDSRVMDGAELPNAPQLQATAGVRYEFPITGSWALALQGDLKYVDDVARTLTEGIDVGSGMLRNPGFTRTDSFTTANARISLLQPE